MLIITAGPAFVRRAAHIISAAALIAGLAKQVRAQDISKSDHRWELLMSSGALVPTGAARQVIKDAPLSTAQVTYVVNPHVAVTSMFGWARSRDVATLDDPKLDIFTYDAGLEVRGNRAGNDSSVTFMPFAGAGAGARSYNYRNLSMDATHNLAAYGAVGGELGAGWLHVRAEVRDYVAAFKPLNGRGVSSTRNDVVAMIGLKFGK